MKTILLCLSMFFPGSILTGQSFTGAWKGTVTRDFGDETVTDSIMLELFQKEDTITGYSILYLKPNVFIRSVLEGAYLSANKMLRLTETSIQATNALHDEDDFFLDRYLLNYDFHDSLVLTGKSVPCEPRAIYTRSKIVLRKIP